MAKNAQAGRPPFKPTAAQRRKVSICAGGGMSHEEIALALGIHRHTLEKYFQHDLSIGAYERRAEVVSAMHKAAVKGNVAAQKAFVAMNPYAAAPPVTKDEPEGKKAKANADAVTAQAGTEWSELLPDGVTPIRKSAA